MKFNIQKKIAMMASEVKMSSKSKVIYTVQHTQSEHHVNGYVDAWGNWNLTELGKD